MGLDSNVKAQEIFFLIFKLEFGLHLHHASTVGKGRAVPSRGRGELLKGKHHKQGSSCLVILGLGKLFSEIMGQFWGTKVLKMYH